MKWINEMEEYYKKGVGWQRIVYTERECQNRESWKTILPGPPREIPVKEHGIGDTGG